MRKLKNEELNRLGVDEFKDSEKLPVIIVLDNIRSMNNIGSLFRTSDSFRVEALYLCGITATPPHREIHKTALGATESVNWKYFEQTMDAVAFLKKEGWQIAGVEQTDDSVFLDQFKPSKNQKYAFLFGNEINGVSEEVINEIDVCIEIPQFGTKHSFNVSVSAGIVLWHFWYKLSNQ